MSCPRCARVRLVGQGVDFLRNVSAEPGGKIKLIVVFALETPTGQLWDLTTLRTVAEAETGCPSTTPR